MGFNRLSPKRTTGNVSVSVYPHSKNKGSASLVFRFGTDHVDYLPEKVDLLFGEDEDDGKVMVVPGNDWAVRQPKNNSGKREIYVRGFLSNKITEKIPATTVPWEIVDEEDGYRSFLLTLPNEVLDVLRLP